MKQIELRLALVLYGGVSLAVHMHGITREFLNLVRASRRMEVRLDQGAPPKADGPAVAAYEAFLALFAPKLDLRVVIDVISGASAGGVNGVMLARALAHNLSLDAHRDLWLENADVSRLANAPVGLTRYIKGSIAPVLDRLVTMALKSETSDAETRAKLRRLMQSRWFTPPFSGARYVGWMLDACHAMRPGDGEGGPATLVPQGQRLDLLVTVTDFHGAKRRFAIHDPVAVEETEHRLILRYVAICRGNGELQSDFGDVSIPDLVFSARATSAFPGAFPPMTFGEMDQVLEARGETWEQRDAFRRRAFGAAGEAGEKCVLVDGSVVMNKPFQPLLEAIAGRAAGREVVRKIVYVDPKPDEVSAPEDGAPDAHLPGFFRVILASLAHIPRNEPIGDALEQVADHNREVRRIAEVIAAAEPLVESEVRAILGPELRHPLTAQELTRCRTMANERAHLTAGYAYRGYQRLKLSGVVERVADLCARVAQNRPDGAPGNPSARAGSGASAIAFRLDVWLASASQAGAESSVTPEPVIRFLRGLDVDYRIRRLRFVIRRLNRLYRLAENRGGVRADEMDELKSTLYEQIDHLSRRWSAAFYGEETRTLVERLLEAPDADPQPADALVATLSARMGLADLDALADDVFSMMTLNYLPQSLHLALTSAYVGFAFYDLVTFPVLRGTAIAEYNEVQVDRISPADAHSLRPDGVALKGRSLNAFGAFFNRGWREHDYLWGRLTAADRLMTMALQAAEPVVRVAEGRVREARRNVFLAILEEERERLNADPALVPDLLREVEEKLSAASAGA
ncbi:patatin-like protein [Stappia sp. ES.058]|uniref:patatin-like protein n=1 Tax=Stappia sp. ES.058 TaxID=1881061 RepID=UPI00087BA5F6|nr:patatin-like protein [Stappia sp. ES.058]SDU20658.1 patatin-related protein [Stappia sp. ES.058]